MLGERRNQKLTSEVLTTVLALTMLHLFTMPVFCIVDTVHVPSGLLVSTYNVASTYDNASTHDGANTYKYHKS